MFVYSRSFFYHFIKITKLTQRMLQNRLDWRYLIKRRKKHEARFRLRQIKKRLSSYYLLPQLPHFNENLEMKTKRRLRRHFEIPAISFIKTFFSSLLLSVSSTTSKSGEINEICFDSKAFCATLQKAINYSCNADNGEAKKKNSHFFISS